MKFMRLVAVLAPLLGCAPRVHTPAPLPALSGEGEVRVYLQPLPRDAARLALSISAVVASAPDGVDEPLEVIAPEISGAAAPGQRLLARGRLPPGSYAGLGLRIPRATLAGDGRPTDLLVPEEPVRVEVPFRVERGRAVLVRLRLRGGQAPAQEFRFDGAFVADAAVAESSAVQLAAYCSTPPLASLTVVDRHARAVSGILPAGRQPTGIALDASRLRAYVALAGDDQLQELDLVTGEELRRIPLDTRDEPREIALTPDGALLVTVNPGSDSVSLVDTAAGAVVAKIPAGEVPSALLLDRSGRRAYVLNRRSRSMTVVDIANAAAVRTVTTDPEPLRAALSRDGTRLYLVARGSAYMTVFSVPDMAVVRTVFVGLGAGAVLVDPRSDLIYVGRADDGKIQIFDPFSDLPLDTIEVPGPVSFLALDRVENTLLAVLPGKGQVAFVDVTRKRLVATVDVGPAAYQVAVLGEQP